MNLLWILIFLSSCAWHPIQENLAQKEIKRITHDFIVISKALKLETRIPNINFVIIEDEFPKFRGAVGLCHHGEIFLDQKWWRQTTIWDKEQVLLHELGHCVLGLDHQKGIMGEKPIPAHVYFKYKTTLIKQMFIQKQRIPAER